MVNDPLTRYMFCSPGQGAVALVLCNRAVADELDGTPVALRAAVVRTRRFGSFEVFSPWAPPGHADQRERGRRADWRSRRPGWARATSTCASSRTPRAVPR